MQREGGLASSQSDFRQEALKLYENLWSDFAWPAKRAYELRIRKDHLREWVIRIVDHEWRDLQSRKSLKPQYFEIAFGSKGESGGFDSVAIPVDGKPVRFRGRIDRVDVDTRTGRAMVVDYKRSKSFSMTDFTAGQVPQAIIYGLFIQQVLSKEAIGVEFFNLKDLKRGGFLCKDYYDDEKPQNRLRSTLVREDYDHALKNGQLQIAHQIQSYHEANIATQPITCRHCSYHSTCRYSDWRKKR